MSASEPNDDKQKRRHKGPFMGMIGVVAFALVLLVILVAFLSLSGNEPANNQPVEEDAAEDSAG